MRHLIDTYIKAGDSEVLSTFENKTLVQLIVQQGTAAAIQALPEPHPGVREGGLRDHREQCAQADSR
jgi:type I restriction enzyme R subunit